MRATTALVVVLSALVGLIVTLFVDHSVLEDVVAIDLLVVRDAARGNETTRNLTERASASPKQQPTTASILKDNLIRNEIYVGQVWLNLIEEGAQLVSKNQTPGVVMEVGMHRAIQCLQAARAGLQAHCVEPSPTSFQRVKGGVRRAPKEVQDRVQLYNVAAGGTSEGTVPFRGAGGTGDHVGDFDMWNMKAGSSPQDSTRMVQVPSMRLDDIVNKVGSVFLLKVDTQGFEPTVFSGLSESLKEHKVKHVIFEYWPRGMDLLAGKDKACVAAKLLQDFADMGYTLYALTGAEAHPRAPEGWVKAIQDRPLDNAMDNCMWYYKVEELFPSDEYKMGYWSDVLAVAPDTPIGDPSTSVGRAISANI